MNRAVALAAAGILLFGCNQPNKRLNAPPHGTPYETTDAQGTLTYMVDNAMLADMTVNDSHFLPHRNLLSTLGVERLSRMASLMEFYGGTVRFNTNSMDEALVTARMETILEFLSDAGLDTTTELVRRDLSGGKGMAATEAILIRVNEGTYDPDTNKEREQENQSQGFDSP